MHAKILQDTNYHSHTLWIMPQRIMEFSEALTTFGGEERKPAQLYVLC